MMDQKIIDLSDEYTHAPLDRRVFLARLAKLTGSNSGRGALKQQKCCLTQQACYCVWGLWQVAAGRTAHGWTTHAW